MEAKSSGLRWNKLAIYGFAFSIIWIYGIGSLIAIVLGIISVVRINRSPGKSKGKGLAIASIILGTLGLILPLWILTSVIWTIIIRS